MMIITTIIAINTIVGIITITTEIIILQKTIPCTGETVQVVDIREVEVETNTTDVDTAIDQVVAVAEMTTTTILPLDDRIIFQNPNIMAASTTTTKRTFIQM
jgi:hypothetical protein